ncbi:hypothetical protein HYQ46_002870 [Verticillium longisporum]|nr:hypothetical protein HYQ46_002870 [Verticillium longisporum]
MPGVRRRGIRGLDRPKVSWAGHRFFSGLTATMSSGHLEVPLCATSRFLLLGGGWCARIALNRRALLVGASVCRGRLGSH